MCGVMTSPALMLQLVVWLKHCFGVLVIFDCCFNCDDGVITIVTEQGL